MKSMKQNLTRQLISLAVIVSGIIFISLGLLLPKLLLPIYEKNIYQYLKQPLELVENNIHDAEFGEDVAYLYVTSDHNIIVSGNMSEIIGLSPTQVLEYANNSHGKFQYLGKTYYYNTAKNQYVTKIALTNTDYINDIKKDVLYTMFPILLITFLLIALIFILWSRVLVKKIEHLKDKIDNLDNEDYHDQYQFAVDDELHTLSIAIDDMKEALKEQEEYKNHMYQNISHDFKTPLTVIKSYMEAIEDGVESLDTGKEVIKEQIDKLELKVHSLLYLNKLNYIKDTKNYQRELVDISTILSSSIEKFKIQRPDVSFEAYVLDKNTSFYGSVDMWEAIIDNMLNNFVRYAEKLIKVTIKNNRITFYNDGPIIDPTILSSIFTPYKKGIKGQFGLGLAIIRETLSIAGYEISVKNEKKGVTFTIQR